MSKLIGKWKHDRSENLEQFLKAMGVGEATLKLIASSSPTVEITIDDATWTVNTQSGTMSIKNTFKIGEPFEDTGPEGVKTKFLATLDGGDVLTMKAVDDSSGPVVTRQIVDGQLVTTLTKSDATARRFYNKA